MSRDEDILKQLESDEKDSDLKALDRALRKEILTKFFLPTEATPYDILEATPYLSAVDLKAQYLALSRRLHPDRFFNRKLGHYKQKLDTVFSRIQKAYAFLKNPYEKEALDRKLQLQKNKSEKAPHADGASEPKKQTRLLDPLIEKIGKAERYYKTGLEQMKSQDYVAASNSFVLAAQTNPQQEKYKKALEDCRPLMHRQKARTIIDNAKKSAQLGYDMEVFKAAEESLRLDPSLADAQLLVGRGIVELRLLDRFKDAKSLLLRAKASLPKDAEPCLYLAKVLIVLEDSKAAKKELEEALRRNPNCTPALKLLENV